jgi:hypothetical protein
MCGEVLQVCQSLLHLRRFSALQTTLVLQVCQKLLHLLRISALQATLVLQVCQKLLHLRRICYSCDSCRYVVFSKGHRAIGLPASPAS